MKALTPTLEAAQQSASATPYVQAILSDHQGLISRFRYSRVYSGSEPGGVTAAVVAGDGSLIRARIDPSTDTLYTQRVAAPNAGSSFSSWVSHGTVSISGTVALAAFGANVYLFFVHADTVRVRMKLSTDNGATYGAASTVATAVSAAVFLAADANLSGDVVLFWTVGADVWSSRFTGTWSTPAAWTESVDSITGLAAYFRSDFQVCITGTATTTADPQVWTILYGDGFELSAGSWGDLLAIESAVDGSGVSFHMPALQFAGSGMRLFYLEKYSGSIASRHLQQSALDLTYDFRFDRWREPWPFDYLPADDYGLAATYANGSNTTWLSTPAGVWLAELDGIEAIDVSANVVAAVVETDEGDGRARIELRNDDGRYTGHPAIARGMRLALTPGYVTSTGAEVPAAAWYWVEAVELITGPRPRVVLHARDGWWLLERWHARRQYSWQAGETVLYDALAFVFARAGLLANATAISGTLQTWEPAFTIHPGESGKSVVTRLLSALPDLIHFHQDGGEVITPEAADPTTYSYGGDHAILAGRYRDVGPAVNRTRVLGQTALAEAIDYADIEAVGERAAAPVRDLNLTTTALATDRASFGLRQAQLRARRDELQVFGVNSGQQLYDVVEITDPGAGLSEARRRVLGLSWRYETAPRPRYDMTLQLGEV